MHRRTLFTLVACECCFIWEMVQRLEEPTFYVVLVLKGDGNAVNKVIPAVQMCQRETCVKRMVEHIDVCIN